MFEIVVAITSFFEIVADVLTCIEYHRSNEQAFFTISVILQVLGTLPMYFMVLGLTASMFWVHYPYWRFTWTDNFCHCTACGCCSIALLPFAPVVNMVLLVIVPIDHTEYRHNSIVNTRSYDHNKFITNNKVWQWSRNRASKYMLDENYYYLVFLFQACFQSLPQSFLQIVAFVVISNKQNKAFLSNATQCILSISLFISIFNVCLHSIMIIGQISFAKYTTHLKTIFCWICLILDYISLLVIIIWMFYIVPKFCFCICLCKDTLIVACASILELFFFFFCSSHDAIMLINKDMVYYIELFGLIPIEFCILMASIIAVIKFGGNRMDCCNSNYNCCSLLMCVGFLLIIWSIGNTLFLLLSCVCNFVIIGIVTSFYVALRVPPDMNGRCCWMVLLNWIMDANTSKDAAIRICCINYCLTQSQNHFYLPLSQTTNIQCGLGNYLRNSVKIYFNNVTFDDLKLRWVCSRSHW